MPPFADMTWLHTLRDYFEFSKGRISAVCCVLKLGLCVVPLLDRGVHGLADTVDPADSAAGRHKKTKRYLAACCKELHRHPKCMISLHG